MENNEIIYKKYQKYKAKYYNLVKKRLLESIYPNQGNDFFFLTIPSGHPNAGKEVPVDWKLCNIIKFFWNNGLITMGWHQGSEYLDCFETAFISFDKKTIDSKNTIRILNNILKKHFDKTQIVVFNGWQTKRDATAPDWENYTEEEAEKEYAKKLTKEKKIIEKFFKNNPDKILIEKESNFVALVFRSPMIPTISNKLKLKLPNHADSFPGNLIPYVLKNDTKEN